MWWVVALVVMVSVVLNLPFFTVKNVEIRGDAEPAASAALASLQGRSIFSGRISQTTANVRHDNLDLKAVSCQRGLPATLRCTLTLRQPALVWSNGGKNYLVDADGLAYAVANSLPDGVMVVQDQGQTAVTMGASVATSLVVDSFHNLQTLLSAQKLHVSNLAVTESLYQVDAVLSGSDNPDITLPATPITAKFTTSYSLEDQVKTVVELLKDKKGQVNQYIDVRVAGYAYFK